MQEKLPFGMRVMFHILADTLRPAMNVMMGKEWINLDKLPKDSGFIVCPNHCTEIDPVLVGQMLYSNGYPPHFLTKASLFKVPVVGKVLAGAQQIPVDRAGPTARRSLEVAQEVLDHNGAIVIYPEGTLTRDPELWPMKGHTGAARLALQTGAEVIPVAHWGAQEVFPRYAKMVKLFPRKKVRMIIGDPVDLDEFRGLPIDKFLLDAATEKILDEITGLLAGLRNETPPAERWDPSQHNQTSRGRQIDKDSEAGDE